MNGNHNSEVLGCIVIGSGPAGWATLEYLVSVGITPTLIDIGNTSERNLGFTTPGSAGASAIAQKIRFGSNHMYTYPEKENVHFDYSGTLPISSARGGLSTVWGSNLQGFLFPEEFEAHNAFLRESFAELISQLPNTGAHDELDQVFTWPEEFKDSTTLSARAKRILKRIKPQKDWALGQARNATGGLKTGCTACGSCLTGCPENVIFSTEARIETLISLGKISYIQGQVTSLKLGEDGIWTLNVRENNQSLLSQILGNKIFLAAGAVASAIILSASELIPKDVELDDTQVLYLPLLSYRDRAEKKTKFSLAQLFLETKKGLFLDNSLHVSIYEHSDSFRERASKIFPRMAPLLPDFMFRRLMAGIAFLPASQSGKVTLHRDNLNSIQVGIREVDATNKAVKTMIKETFWLFFKMGLVPILPFLSSGNVGASYHVGNLTNHGERLLDSSGALFGSPNLYVVDGCSLPAIPAGPITLGIMANARRISKQAIQK